MEEILEPARPICDPHHHLWDHPGRRYLLDELIADTSTGGHGDCHALHPSGHTPAPTCSTSRT